MIMWTPQWVWYYEFHALDLQNSDFIGKDQFEKIYSSTCLCYDENRNFLGGTTFISLIISQPVLLSFWTTHELPNWQHVSKSTLWILDYERSYNEFNSGQHFDRLVPISSCADMGFIPLQKKKNIAQWVPKGGEVVYLVWSSRFP